MGLVHATVNATALALQVASLAARRRGARGRGIALSAVSFGALTFGGWLGGHLIHAHGVSVDQTVFDPGPEEWTPVGTSGDDLAERAPRTVQVGDTPVMLVRSAGRIHALHDRCSHRGCSLAGGDVERTRSSATATAAASRSTTGASCAARHDPAARLRGPRRRGRARDPAARLGRSQGARSGAPRMIQHSSVCCPGASMPWASSAPPALHERRAAPRALDDVGRQPPLRAWRASPPRR
jgi:nitrite reductase/ring-hydroxylating ferredoxin subunit